ncbi:MAG: hypothetical protein CMK89_02255 [Pseudomonadales bacterium]|nr:hypothetical protein [Pseudomonadales bacterium]
MTAMGGPIAGPWLTVTGVDLSSFLSLPLTAFWADFKAPNNSTKPLAWAKGKRRFFMEILRFWTR